MTSDQRAIFQLVSIGVAFVAFVFATLILLAVVLAKNVYVGIALLHIACIVAGIAYRMLGKQRS